MLHSAKSLVPFNAANDGKKIQQSREEEEKEKEELPCDEASRLVWVNDAKWAARTHTDTLSAFSAPARQMADSSLVLATQPRPLLAKQRLNVVWGKSQETELTGISLLTSHSFAVNINILKWKKNITSFLLLNVPSSKWQLVRTLTSLFA